MRGAERPGKMKWTRPFLPPLATLTTEAAQKVFYDISDVVDKDAQVTELLKFTDNLPLAVTLIASLAEFEGCDSVFKRWKLESTSILSDGLDKQNNLDRSILLSFTSPRMTACPGSQELLSLLALLPNGISEETLKNIGIPISNIARCRTALCRTSLTFVDHDNHLKVLAPIRQCIQRKFPPSHILIQPLQDYMFCLVQPFSTWEHSPIPGIFQQVAENLGNIHSLLEHALSHLVDDVTLQLQVINCLLDLSSYDYLMGRADVYSNQLLLQLEPTVQQLNNTYLQGRYTSTLVQGSFYSPTLDITAVESWAQTAIQCFKIVKDISGQGKYIFFLYLINFFSTQYSYSCNISVIIKQISD